MATNITPQSGFENIMATLSYINSSLLFIIMHVMTSPRKETGEGNSLKIDRNLELRSSLFFDICVVAGNFAFG